MFFLTLFAVSALWYFHIWFQKHRPLTLGCFFFTYEIESCKVKGKSKFNFIFDIFLPSFFFSFISSFFEVIECLFSAMLFAKNWAENSEKYTCYPNRFYSLLEKTTFLNSQMNKYVLTICVKKDNHWKL